MAFNDDDHIDDDGDDDDDDDGDDDNVHRANRSWCCASTPLASTPSFRQQTAY